MSLQWTMLLGLDAGLMPITIVYYCWSYVLLRNVVN